MTAQRPGKVSFLHTSMIVDTPTTFLASSQATGAVSKPQKEGAGVATAVVEGTYTGTNNIDFYVEIDSGSGAIGATTFRWSSNGGTSFDAVGVATSTNAVGLKHGLSIRWIAGTGTDLVTADRWRFRAFLPFHRNRLLDRERDTEWRSLDGALTNVVLTADLTAPRTPQAFVLLDHNLSAGASIRLQGASGSGFSPLTVDYAIPWRAEHVLHFLGEPLHSVQWWRVVLSDAGNADNYLRASELFLGGYDRLARAFELGDLRGKLRVGQRDRLLSGKYYGAVNTVVRAYDFSWVRLSQDDRDTLVDVFDALNDLSGRRVLPVFFSPTSEDLSQIALCEWTEGQIVATSETDAPERYHVPVRLTEVPRTLEGLADILSTETLSTGL